tara:strand:+ start:657 stop:1016 length:360 start_codon:yes stop_codon:yes gene_type:complete
MKSSFKLRSQNSSFKEMGSSPVKYVLPVLKGLYKGAKMILGSKKAKNTAKVLYGAGVVDAYASKKDMSVGEKVLRTVDEWGPTMGVASYMVDNRPNETQIREKNERDSRNVHNSGKPKW